MELQAWLFEERGRAAALARYLGVRQPVVADWASGKKPVPAKRAMGIEQFSGGRITRQQLVEDWRSYWPELADPAPQPVEQGAA